ncbi:MAG: DUF177 domain-containing protein [Chitinophagaceae bacterium]
MGNRRAFDIAFVGLKPGVHEFEYRIDDKFFESYGEQDFHNCQADVKLTLDKKNGFILLTFDISGTVGSQCDRCGNPLTLHLWDEFNIIVKMVEEPNVMNEKEDDPDVYYISRTESHLKLSDWIYEFVNLSIPNQHYCGEDADGKAKCNPEVLSKLAQMERRADEADEIAKKENSIWKDLDKFKDLDDEE